MPHEFNISSLILVTISLSQVAAPAKSISSLAQSGAGRQNRRAQYGSQAKVLQRVGSTGRTTPWHGGYRTDRRLRGRHHGRVKATRKWAGGQDERFRLRSSEHLANLGLFWLGNFPLQHLQCVLGLRVRHRRDGIAIRKPESDNLPIF